MDDVTTLQRVKAQAEVLIPLVRRLESEIGVERARSIVREVLSEYYRSLAKDFVEQSGGDRLAAFGKFAEWFGVGEAFAIEPQESPPGRIDVNVVRCEYAKFFQALNEPDLGFLLLCSADYPMSEGLGMGLERSQTIMQGADHCDFHWILPEAQTTTD
ncbi:MAG TPA: L-2-amino-thiazoline-4-carboxylic acid hydrolase [Candidatus Dormibacteraeota bacterium]|nr:L-2-amino-thiazoline-4-carboxylic acid hydrolase [Candidatus Dormibacteraeota bacterium]